MRQYYAGVDGGGTKTAIIVLDAKNGKRYKTQTGSASWRELGVQTVVASIFEALEGLIPDVRKKLAGIAMGLPCYGESVYGDQQLEAEVKTVFSEQQVYLTNDVEVGWAGSLALQPGINVVAGTGSIAYGRDEKGNTARCGGWDEFFSDEGSCYWMGRKMMEYFSKQADGRLPRGPLYSIVRKEFKMKDDMEFIDRLRAKHLDQRESVASLQILVEKAALEGDESAKLLYRQAAEELVLLVQALFNKLSFPQSEWKVSYSGGLFKAKDLVLPYFKQLLNEKGAQVLAPRCSPVEGAVLLALNHFCPEMKERFLDLCIES